MGVKFARDYEDIVSDMSHAVPNIDNFYQFFHMEKEQWERLTEEEQKECTRTLCDDLIFALGSRPSIQVEGGRVAYERKKNVITVHNGGNVIAIINLV